MATTTYYVYGLETTNAMPTDGSTRKSATYRLMCTDTDQDRAKAVATRLKLIFRDVLVTSNPTQDLQNPGQEGTLDPGHII